MATDKNSEWPGLGHTEARGHHDALTDLALGMRKKAVPYRLRQCGSGVEKHLHTR